MTKKERVLKALRHEQPDITPWHISFTIPILEKLKKYYGREDVDEVVGNHFLVKEAEFKWEEIKKDYWKDEFGVIWDRRINKDIGTVSNCVLENKKDLEKYKFPEIGEWRFKGLENINNKEKFVVFNYGFSLFERAWTLRGMENLLMDMVTDRPFVEELLDRILEFNLEIIRYASKYPIDAILFGDDWGQQRGLLMGPRYWREYIKPRIARMYKEVKEKGLYVAIHSCGCIDEIIPDLIEIGVDILNPFQPEVMDIYKVKEKYGEKLTFWGGVSTQKTLPYGTEEEVKKEVISLIKKIGKGGGFILSPAHAVPKDVPLRNVLVLIEVLFRQNYLN